MEFYKIRERQKIREASIESCSELENDAYACIV